LLALNPAAFDKVKFCLENSATDEEFIGMLILFGYGEYAKAVAAT
jgi:hypothetical protein